MNPTLQTTLPILYSFRRCPYAMRARLALLASGQTCEHREILLRDKPAAMLQASPKGTVPVLVLPSGQVLAESLDIMLWALYQADPLKWLTPSTVTLIEVIALVRQCDGRFKPLLDAYKYPIRILGGTDVDGELDKSAGSVDAAVAARDKAAQFLSQLNQQLTDKAGLFGPGFGFADAAIAPFVRQFAGVHPAWFASQPWPALQHWLVDFCESAAFATIMEKHAVWKRSPHFGPANPSDQLCQQ